MKVKKLLSVLLAISMLCSFACCFAMAGDNNVVIGKAYISFVDNGVRPARAETDDPYKYPDPVGTIYGQSEVELRAGDTVGDVTKRFVEKVKGKGATVTIKTSSYEYEGVTYSSDYLSSINNVTTDSGVVLDSFGEFDAGPQSGWMVRLNNQFLPVGIDQAYVDIGDEIAWMYSCQWGADIGNDWSVTSADITGLHFTAGSLSPAFSTGVKDYTLNLPKNATTIKVEADVANYSAKVTYTLIHSGRSVEYKYYRDIPVNDGDTLIIKSEYSGNTDTVNVHISIEESQATDFFRAFIQAIINFFKNLFANLTK